MNFKYRLFNFSKLANSDTLAMQGLHPLVKDFGYLPFTGSALSPSAISTVLNDIVINNRKDIIEFGSGISTLVIASLLKSNNIKASFISVDEDKIWLELIQSQLNKFDLIKFCDLKYAPVKKNSNGNSWYDYDKLAGIKTLDLILVDGPNAKFQNSENIRKNAFSFIENRLNENFSVFLDDCNRPSEFQILKNWSKKLNAKELLLYQHLGVLLKGKHFNIALL